MDCFSITCGPRWASGPSVRSVHAAVLQWVTLISVWSLHSCFGHHLNVTHTTSLLSALGYCNERRQWNFEWHYETRYPISSSSFGEGWRWRNARTANKIPRLDAGSWNSHTEPLRFGFQAISVSLSFIHTIHSALTSDQVVCVPYPLSSRADQGVWQAKCSGYKPPQCGLTDTCTCLLTEDQISTHRNDSLRSSGIFCLCFPWPSFHRVTRRRPDDPWITLQERTLDVGSQIFYNK